MPTGTRDENDNPVWHLVATEAKVVRAGQSAGYSMGLRPNHVDADVGRAALVQVAPTKSCCEWRDAESAPPCFGTQSPSGGSGSEIVKVER